MVELSQRLANLSPAKRKLLEQGLAKRPEVAEPIAVVGMACRFPGADNPQRYWQLIREGRDATGEIPASRWNVDELYDPTGELDGKMSTRWGGFVDRVDEFDPVFFGITPREAITMDPQQRLLLEVSWEALEYAGMAPDRVAGTRTGVFVGIGGTDYSKLPSQFEDYYQRIDAHVGTGNALSIAANRISYVLDLHGPSLSLDTACSSALVALHYAIQSLRNRECDAALAGGVNLILSPETTIAFSKARMLSPDGRCRPFDKDANGYVRGEGCGMVVLKRLTDATQAGDHILAVIRSSAVNQDGRTSGITAPNSNSQKEAIRTALARAGLTPEQVTYIEAHGTGTPLGDPIEVQALAEVFRRRTPYDLPCYMSSVKANIGHLETASGIAGLIKVILMMQHRQIPAQTHFQEQNPNMQLEGTRLEIPRTTIEWNVPALPRLAGVSSFGFGGTNAHLVIEEASVPQATTAPPERPMHVLTFSAKSESALRQIAANYAQHLQEHPEISLGDICYTANTGRSQFNQRLALRVEDRQSLLSDLEQIAQGDAPSRAKFGYFKAAARPKIAFLFTGQGSQYVEMGRSLYETQPVFRRALEQCDEILHPWLDQSLLSVLYPEPGASSPLDETVFTQPALFALEYSLAMLWKSWGIEPDVVMGHSVGEYVAACVAGVFGLEDGLRLITDRARLMQQLPHDGWMAVVFAPVNQVQSVLERYPNEVAVAAINGPENTVISGRMEIVAELLSEFEARGIRTQRLTVSHAFHSPLMDPMLDEFEQLAREASYQSPRVALISNLTGQITNGELLDASYWRTHIRQPVQFARGMQELAELKPDIILEIGPSTSLLGMGRRCLPRYDAQWLASLRKGQDDWTVLLSSVQAMYVAGVSFDWSGFDRPWPRRRVPLPTYPFERARYWFDLQGNRRHFHVAHGPSLHPLLGSRIPSALQSQLFESRWSSTSPKYFVDHQVQGAPVVPAAAYIEQALAAAQQVFGPGQHGVENVSIQQALFLPPGSSRNVQLVVQQENARQGTFSTYSAPADQQATAWTLHACGRIQHAETLGGSTPQPLAVAELRPQLFDRKTRSEFYELMRQRTLVYGPAFQVLDELLRDERQALAEVRLPESVEKESAQYHLHPALLDGLLQITACIIPLEPDRGYSPYTYMPISVRRLRVLQQVNGPMYVYALRRSGEGCSPEYVDGDVYLLNEQGEVLVELVGVRIQRVGRPALADDGSDPHQWLYRLEWEPLSDEASAGDDKARDEARPPSVRPGQWLIFADQSGLGQQLAAQLKAQQQQCTLVVPEELAETVSNARPIDPLQSEAYARVLRELAERPVPLRGVVHLWSLDIPAGDETQSVEDSRRLGCGSALLLIQQLSRLQLAETPSLWLITRGAHRVESSDQTVSAAQAPLWGLGRVAALEHADLQCRLVDCDPERAAEEQTHLLCNDLLQARGEDQLAYRGERRYAPRLQPATSLLDTSQAARGSRVPPEGAFRLQLGEPGSFDSLRFHSCPRQQPGPGKVEVEVQATGLNFSDVLKAMGLYPGLTDEIVPLGIEAAGVVTAVGEGVRDLQVGDAVMGVIPYSFASHAITADYALVRKPAELTAAEASTIPITFLTAHYGLCRLAQLQPGERVLIHAGAGGVGLAAIQIAQHLGAEIYATAGSEEKRDYLRSLGVQHVFSSRTTEFADQILEVTNHEGVDVVLNSLPGEAIQRSLGILRAYGRFLEIGKTDIYQNRMIGLQPFQDNLSYFAIDLDRMLRQRPDYIRGLFAEVADYVQQGIYRPLPFTQFAVEETVEAFRYMAQRKNIGKVVVAVGERSGSPSDSNPVRRVRENATYLITGGLGALGQSLAEWLVRQGARHLVLLSRRGLTDSVRQPVEQLEAKGARVAVLQADVADAESLAAALSSVPADFPPLAGIFHAAGVLEDGLLYDMQLAQLDRVFSPKVDGAWNLHRLTREQPLDFFVMFSSIASLLGSPGQANYAAANAFLDGLAQQRRASGLPALSINWGPWGGAGMAVEASRSEGLENRGMRLMPPEKALGVLEKLMTLEPEHVAVVDARWDELLRWIPGGTPPLLQHLQITSTDASTTGSASIDEAFHRELGQADVATRERMLREYLANQLAEIMGVTSDSLDAEQPLNTMGLDSLMALELKNKLEKQLLFSLPMAQFLDSPSLASLAAYMASHWTGGEAADGKEPSESQLDAAGWSPIVRVTASDAASNVFCLHPLGGDIRCYESLARSSNDLSLYALRARGAEGLLVPHNSIQEMAADYLAAIQEVQPQGPYHLLGWSAGGIYAYELAHELLRRGEQVAGLVLIDTPLPSIYDHIDLEDDARFLCDIVDFMNRFVGSAMEVSYEQLRQLPPDEQFEFALREAKKHRVVPPELASEHIRRLVDVAKANVRWIMGYTPQPFEPSLKVHLVRADVEGFLAEVSGQNLSEDLGWSSILGNQLQLHRTPGDHFTMMLGENASVLAAQLREWLGR